VDVIEFHDLFCVFDLLFAKGYIHNLARLGYLNLELVYNEVRASFVLWDWIEALKTRVLSK
jgi:hypothetical protein